MLENSQEKTNCTRLLRNERGEREGAEDVGVTLWDTRRNEEWKVEWLMFAGDTVLVGDSEEKLSRLVQEFGNVCQRRKLTMNERKSKIM